MRSGGGDYWWGTFWTPLEKFRRGLEVYRIGTDTSRRRKASARTSRDAQRTRAAYKRSLAKLGL